MPFAERLFAGGLPVALEITPPQRPLPQVLLRRARLLGPWAAAVNVIQRPGRQSSLAASCELRAASIEPAWHLVTRGLARDQLAADIATARAAGIAQVLCIRGDHAAPDEAGGLTIRDAIAFASEAMPGACIGATLSQYAPDPDAAMRNLLPKLKAGATYIQTQPAWDAETLRPAVERVRAAAPGTKVVAMAMPLLSLDALEKLEARLGIALPGAVRAGIGEDGAGAWPAFAATVANLAHSGLIDALAIMTFEMDATPEMGERICAALAAAGLQPEVG
ncbi:MAG: methylenetetrahydrofolate reductase [Chloroflexi bacterium]|nr:methylenetetrahydrofolate reductase [Chloroflexota bacterium]